RTIFVTAATAIAANAMATKHPSLAILCLKNSHIEGGFYFLGERLGSGDGERKTLLTRQIAFEPLPASVLFGLD
ncbi:MAG: hypothetical protein AB7Q64_16470, partial [Verrucomicrobiales bacterium]